jgi:hypothetical protein
VAQRGVLGVDDTGASILLDAQRRCGIVSRGLVPAAMWLRTKVRVRPWTLHYIFHPRAFLLAGGGPLPSYRANSWLRRSVKNVLHWS